MKYFQLNLKYFGNISIRQFGNISPVKPWKFEFFSNLQSIFLENFPINLKMRPGHILARSLNFRFRSSPSQKNFFRLDERLRGEAKINILHRKTSLKCHFQKMS